MSRTNGGINHFQCLFIVYSPIHLDPLVFKSQELKYIPVYILWLILFLMYCCGIFYLRSSPKRPDHYQIHYQLSKTTPCHHSSPLHINLNLKNVNTLSLFAYYIAEKHPPKASLTILHSSLLGINSNLQNENIYHYECFCIFNC